MKNLSPRASRIVNGLSQNIARAFSSGEIQPEHIILAMIKTKEGTGYFALKKAGIDLNSFSFCLEKSLSGCGQRIGENEIELIPMGKRTEKLLEAASMECEKLGDDSVGTEHILLAAMQESGSVSLDFFSESKISAGTMRDLVKFSRHELKISEELMKTSGGMPTDALHRIFKKLDRTGENLENPLPPKNLQETEAFHEKNPLKERKESKSFLSEFSRDITRLYMEGKADPVVGREKEIQRLIQILSRRTKNNPVLVGEPGIGKTAIVEGLAQSIAGGKVPSALAKKRILSLDLAALIAGTKYRGEFEERMKRMMNEVRLDSNIILFIDELHTIIGAGGPEGTMDASNMLKPALSRSELQIIGATTTKEYSRYIEKDSALERRFQMIRVEEPSDEETVKILEGIKKQYEDFHGIIYDDDVIPLIVKLARRYIPERFLPDKAIDILDEAGAEKKLNEDKEPEEFLELEKQIEALVDEKKELVKNQDYENAAYVRNKVIELKGQLELYARYWKEKGLSKKSRVSSDDVSKVVCTLTGIPVERLDRNESRRLVDMEKEMHGMVIGQDDAVRSISGAVRRSRAGISSPKRPIGSFIFLGPTGVGKTQLAKALAKFMFGSEDFLVRVDMSDFMEKHNASRLVGAPPGYIGYEDGGILTEKVRRNPYSVLLLDEIEKAHPDVFNLLLQILEEGELSDSQGHTVNFRNTVIIMTSNAGARKITSESRVGFSLDKGTILPYDQIKANAESELKKLLNPELINRIDDIIVFKALEKKEVSQILDIQIDELASRLEERNLTISLKPSARRYLIEKGYEPSMGARPMRRIIQKEIEEPLATKILDEKNNGFHRISVECFKGRLKISFTDKKNAKSTTIKCISMSNEREDSSVLATVNVLEKK